MTRLLFALSVTLLPAPALAGSAIADVICFDRDTMVQRLEIVHNAQRQGRGMRGPDALLEVWAVPSTGEWTLVQNYANGRSCIVAMGNNWEGTREDPA